jgi:hypothetical protein
MAKPITNESIKKGKYNMVPDFCKNDLIPYFQSSIKPIVLIVTNQVQVPDPEVTHLQTPLKSPPPLSPQWALNTARVPTPRGES